MTIYLIIVCIAIVWALIPCVVTLTTSYCGDFREGDIISIAGETEQEYIVTEVKSNTCLELIQN